MTVRNFPALDWSIQTVQPTPDKVGLIVSDEPTRRAVAGLLLGTGNAWPDNDDPRMHMVVIDHDKQADYCWIARQLLKPATPIVVTVLASDADPTIEVDSAGILQIGIPQAIAGASYSLSL